MSRKKSKKGNNQLISDEQEEEVERINRVIKLFELHPEITTAIIALGEQVAILITQRNSISKESVSRDELKKSSTDMKTDARSTFAQTVYMYSRTLRALGKTRNIAELKNLTGLCQSLLNVMRFGALTEKGQLVANLMKKYKTDLTKYDISEAEITEFENSVKEYSDTISSVDAQTAQGTGATQDLNALFSNAKHTLSIITDIVEGAQKKHQEFYNEFRAANVTLHHGGRHKKKENPSPQNPSEPQNPSAPQGSSSQQDPSSPPDPADNSSAAPENTPQPEE